jgi:biopolymer transport protein ExbD
MKLRKRHKAESEIFTDTLVDILFIVLMFFLIMSTAANPNTVNVNNPKASKEQKVKQQIMVTIDKDQQFYIGRTKVDKADFDTLLTHEILKYKKAPTDTPVVVINADTSAYYGEVFKIMRLAKSQKAKVVARVE